MSSAGSPTVAVVLHEPIVGGATIGVLRIVPHLQERGWRFVFWAPGPGALHDHLQAQGYEVDGRPRLLRYSREALRVEPGIAARLQSVPRYLLAFRRWLARQGPAIVHANTVITIPEAIVARTTRATTLLYVHEILPAGAKGLAAGTLIRGVADAVIVSSETSVAALRRARVEPRKIAYGIEAPPARGARAAGDRVVIGTLGTISRRKGSDVFLRAAAHVRDELPGVELRMIGPLADGPERDWARGLVARAQADGIIWDTTDDAFAELAGWDLLVLPSRREPFGLVVIEAMASGLPVVASAIDGPAEIVTPQTGVLVAPDDPEALAAAIVELGRDPARRAALGAAGRARVEHAYTLDAQADAVDAIYRELAARAARAP